MGSLDILSAIIDDGYIFTQAEEYEEEKMRTAVANIKSILKTIEVIWRNFLVILLTIYLTQP